LKERSDSSAARISTLGGTTRILEVIHDALYADPTGPLYQFSAGDVLDFHHRRRQESWPPRRQRAVFWIQRQCPRVGFATVVDREHAEVGTEAYLLWGEAIMPRPDGREEHHCVKYA